MFNGVPFIVEPKGRNFATDVTIYIATKRRYKCELQMMMIMAKRVIEIISVQIVEMEFSFLAIFCDLREMGE